MAGQVSMWRDTVTQAPVQCEDNTDPNHFMVVYDTDSYECSCINVTMCQPEVGFVGPEVISWGEWTFPLVRSPVFIQAVTSSVEVTAEDNGDMEPPVSTVSQTDPPFCNVNNFHNVDQECLGVNTYTDGPEDDENFEDEENEKEDSDYSLNIY